HALATAGGFAEQLLEESTEVLGFEIELLPVARGTLWPAAPGIGARARPTTEIDTRGLRLLDLFPIGTPAVVLLTFFGVGEDRVGITDLFEEGFRFCIAGVDVGVMFTRELAIGGFDVLVGSGAWDAENGVIIAFGAAGRHAGPSLVN